MFIMVKHVISVCIFCFICATHTPCASHAEISTNSALLNGPYKEDNNFSPNINDFGDIKRIQKRNSEGDNLGMDKYIKKLFTEYGNGESMNLKEFSNFVGEVVLRSKLGPEERVNSEPSKENVCPENSTISLTFHEMAEYSRVRGEIDNTSLLDVCPAILYSILKQDCNLDVHADVKENISKGVVFIYSIIAVVIISLCGIFGLFVIPIMQTTYYHRILQFLIAMAIGTLAGDALLHLLPHAMSSHDHHGGGHNKTNLYKGFVAMLGLILFFIMERLITISAKWRQKKLKDKTLPRTLNIMSKEGTAKLTSAADKQCKHKYSSFPYCYDEITVIDIPREDRTFRLAGGAEIIENHKDSIETSNLDRIESSSDVERNQNMTECPSDTVNGNCTEINKMLPQEPTKEDDGREYTVILREHESKHHGHSHTHGHVHSAPKNFSSVVWMVIMGDGLHNFTDGLAIGAAFSNNVAGGISTAVAVFCHELPHELGDFALLLKAGMSIKQAILYNLLSSILSLLGNCVGVWLGNIEYASTWVFAAAAGMFLYIALVDMMPELTLEHNGEKTFYQCIVHLGGLLTGFAIMTVIALYEHDLKNMFTT